jgi:hypothetical protein
MMAKYMNEVRDFEQRKTGDAERPPQVVRGETTPPVTFRRVGMGRDSLQKLMDASRGKANPRPLKADARLLPTRFRRA